MWNTDVLISLSHVSIRLILATPLSPITELPSIPPSTLISLMASLEQALCNLLITLLFVYFAFHSRFSVELICPN